MVPREHPTCLVDQSTATNSHSGATGDEATVRNDELTFGSTQTTGRVDRITAHIGWSHGTLARRDPPIQRLHRKHRGDHRTSL